MVFLVEYHAPALYDITTALPCHEVGVLYINPLLTLSNSKPPFDIPNRNTCYYCSHCNYNCISLPDTLYVVGSGVGLPAMCNT